MSKPMNRRAASTAFAKGENPRTACALTFVGNVAYSYAEPIAIRCDGYMVVTDAKFSMTTSHHRGAVAGAYAVENGSENVHTVDHGAIRAQVKSYGMPVGPAGAQYDIVKA